MFQTIFLFFNKCINFAIAFSVAFSVPISILHLLLILSPCAHSHPEKERKRLCISIMGNCSRGGGGISVWRPPGAATCEVHPAGRAGERRRDSQSWLRPDGSLAPRLIISRAELYSEPSPLLYRAYKCGLSFSRWEMIRGGAAAAFRFVPRARG